MRLTALTLSILLGALLLVAAVPPKPSKPGTCPASPIPKAPCPTVIPEDHRQCNNDQDCTGEKKCCQHACQVICKDPIEPPKPPKPGMCPFSPVPYAGCLVLEKPKDLCVTDQDCTGKNKCCREFCHMMCKDPEEPPKPPKPGMCPFSPVPYAGCLVLEKPKDLCFTDQECTGKKKCCREFCHMMCKDPEAPPKLSVKPGTCPFSPVPIVPCREELLEKQHQCTSDKDCTGKRKCCRESCRMMCKDPEE